MKFVPDLPYSICIRFITSPSEERRKSQGEGVDPSSNQNISTSDWRVYLKNQAKTWHWVYSVDYFHMCVL